MDEGLLNDLLECSVCLERLDTSSRVLPCQHTFCLKCLKEIVESHKELRCPECRVLVGVKLEELPPNVLLMRILEGMKHSGAPRKLPAGGRNLKNINSHHQVLQSHNHRLGIDGKPIPPHGRAIHEFIAKEPGDLSFKKGEIILLQKKLDQFWHHGECNGRSGIFPITYLQVLVPLPTPAALCKALYDFRMSAPDEEGCLAFDKGTILTVHRRVDENWAEGRIEDRVGIFPIAFVELNPAAKQLMNSSTMNRPVPALPDHSRTVLSEHRHVQHIQRLQQMSMSTPIVQPVNYQNVSMSQSHPNYSQTQPISNISQNLLTTALPRSIIEQSPKLDLIHLNVGQTLGLQTVSPRIGESYETRLRNVKYENYSSPMTQKTETNYQNVRCQAVIANFNNTSSDSSSSVNTPGISVTTTPNTSVDNSESTESPSLPSSPDNVLVEPAAPEIAEVNESEVLNASVAQLTLTDTSTATNTSLNVSLPPENSNASGSEVLGREEPCSSKLQRNGLGLQSVVSPVHSKESGYMSRTHRELHRESKEKRNSLTQAGHLQVNQHSTPNRHSAEILATSLLDHVPERERDRSDRERERERRRRRSRSNERPLPAAYVALYPYKPQKSDELELKKGGVYMVTEKCRDGWYKGRSERTQRGGVFPGNYVTAATAIRPKHDKVLVNLTTSRPTVEGAPDAPPRADTPPIYQDPGQPASYPWTATSSPLQSSSKAEKSKEKAKQEKSSLSSGVSLMKRLAAMKKCKSPPPVGYSMDNPVFEDGPGTSLHNAPPATLSHHPVHVRSGSCPSQLLGTFSGSASHRLRPRERPSVLPRHEAHRSTDNPWQSQHRKSQSLDVTSARKDRHSQPVKERFRCIVPYPPNSEYELELKVDDIVYVHRKRGDGWYKGTLQRTGRTGLFPASFVQISPAE